jgi:hypothetical protein
LEATVGAQHPLPDHTAPKKGSFYFFAKGDRAKTRMTPFPVTAIILPRCRSLSARSSPCPTTPSFLGAGNSSGWPQKRGHSTFSQKGTEPKPE